MTSVTRIVQLYKSRRTLIALLAAQGFDVDEYAEFSANEVSTMYANSQLDMLVTRKADGCKTYVRYHSSPTSKNIRTSLDAIVEDLYSIEKVLGQRDTLMVVVDDEPNDAMLTRMRYIYETAGVFVVMHHIKRLQFNILEHSLVPRMEVLSDAEREAFMREYGLRSPAQIPEISRFDAQALAIALRPGQVCRIHRPSETAITALYYRVCI